MVRCSLTLMQDFWYWVTGPFQIWHYGLRTIGLHLKSIFVEELEHFFIFFNFAFYVVREKECRNFIFCNFVSKKGHVICWCCTCVIFVYVEQEMSWWIIHCIFLWIKSSYFTLHIMLLKGSAFLKPITVISVKLLSDLRTFNMIWNNKKKFEFIK